MKCTITFESDKPFVVPVYYHQAIQGFIYHFMPEELAEFVHEHGYKKGNQSFKLFTFSRLQGESKYDQKTKTLTFHSPIKLVITSCIPTLIEEISKNLLLSEKVILNNPSIKLTEVHTEKIRVKSTKILTEAISPITTYTTYERRNGKNVTHYFTPFDRVFTLLIEDNLFKKYEAFHNVTVPSEAYFEVMPYRVTSKDKVVTKYKSTIINGWGGKYVIESSDTKYIEFALLVGNGSKNSQGFGCMVKIQEL